MFRFSRQVASHFEILHASVWLFDKLGLLIFFTPSRRLVEAQIVATRKEEEERIKKLRKNLRERRKASILKLNSIICKCTNLSVQRSNSCKHYAKSAEVSDICNITLCITSVSPHYDSYQTKYPWYFSLL